MVVYNRKGIIECICTRIPMNSLTIQLRVKTESVEHQKTISDILVVGTLSGRKTTKGKIHFLLYAASVYNIVRFESILY